MISLLKDAISLGFYISGNFRQDNSSDNELALLYHSVGEINTESDPYKVNVAPELFNKHLEFLSLRQNGNLILTFDDGFENFFHNAYPVISKYNFKTVLFITTDFIDRNISFDHLFKNAVNLKPLSWEQIRKVRESGIEIGSHAKSHLKLTTLNDEALYKEIRDSKKIIEDAIGKKVKYFAYPYGGRKSLNRHIQEIVKEAGYEKAYTNIMGFNHKKRSLYELRRLRIYSMDNLFRFKMKINGAYNWVDYLAR